MNIEERIERLEHNLFKSLEHKPCNKCGELPKDLDESELIDSTDKCNDCYDYQSESEEK